MSQVDTSKSQAWFITCAFEDIYHIDLLVMQGTLGEILPQLRHLSERTGGVFRVFATIPATFNPSSNHYAKAMHEVVGGLVCQSVGHLNRDFKFEEWKAAFRHVFDEVPEEQKEVELVNFQLRIEKELNAMRIRKGLTELTPEVIHQKVEELRAKPDEPKPPEYPTIAYCSNCKYEFDKLDIPEDKVRCHLCGHPLIEGKPPETQSSQEETQQPTEVGEHDHEKCGCTYLGNNAWNCGVFDQNDGQEL